MVTRVFVNGDKAERGNPTREKVATFVFSEIFGLVIPMTHFERFVPPFRLNGRSLRDADDSSFLASLMSLCRWILVISQLDRSVWSLRMIDRCRSMGF